MPDESEIVERLVRIETKLDGFMSSCNERHVLVNEHLKGHPTRVEELHNCSKFCNNVAKAMWVIVPATVAVIGKTIWAGIIFVIKKEVG